MGLRIKKNCMKGTSSVAINSDTPNTIVTAQGNKANKSYTIPVHVKRNGKNVMLMASVAENIDLKKCVVLSIEACHRDFPSPIYSK